MPDSPVQARPLAAGVVARRTAPGTTGGAHRRRGRPRGWAAGRAAPALLALLALLAAVVGGATARPVPAEAVAGTPGGSDAAAGETFEQIAADAELTDDHARLFRLYWAFFGRSPDPEGARYWINQRDRCAELTTIATSFAASAEFAARYGPLDNAGFVEQIYRNVLDRPGDPEGLAYWRATLSSGRLDRGGVVLYISLSGELTARHPYPSDGVRPRSCLTPDGRPTGRSVDILTGSPPPALATVAGLTLHAPATLVERGGFHQSTHPGAQEMTGADPAPFRLSTLPSRERGTSERGAIDVVVEPSTPITAPVTGTVKRAGAYTLYCRYQDSYVVITPEARPDLEVKLLHLKGLVVKPGQRVNAGDKVAGRANTFPFTSQVDGLTVTPPWPHVHLEVVDPSVPRPPGPGC